MSEGKDHRFLSASRTDGSASSRADRMMRRSDWIYGGIAALLIVLGTWRIATFVWARGNVAARTALVFSLTFVLILAANDLRRRQLGVVTGFVVAVWFILTLLVILFGDLFLVLTGR